MFRTFVEGMALGLTICFLIGPVFFTLLQTSVHRGLKSGILLALGVSLSDLTLIVISFFGATAILDNPTSQFYIGLIGGIILVIFGVVTILRKVVMDSNNNQNNLDLPRPTTYVAKGYFMNIANPFLLIWWVGAMSIVSANYGFKSTSVYVFFTGTIITVFTTDVIKCFIANQLKKFLNYKILLWINRLVGALLIIFGIILLVRVCYTF